jgi:hypothetical protein
MWVSQNVRGDLLTYIMRRFKVEPQRASRIVSKLSTDSQTKLYKRIKTGQIKIRVPKRKPQRRSVSRRYLKWSNPEINFIRRNTDLKGNVLVDRFNTRFGTKRTRSSILSKKYKL